MAGPSDGRGRGITALRVLTHKLPPLPFNNSVTKYFALWQQGSRFHKGVYIYIYACIYACVLIFDIIYIYSRTDRQYFSGYAFCFRVHSMFAQHINKFVDTHYKFWRFVCTSFVCRLTRHSRHSVSILPRCSLLTAGLCVSNESKVVPCVAAECRVIVETCGRK